MHTLQRNQKPVTEQEIESKKTASGGWTKKQLAEWGVPWPPPKGWKNDLIAGKINVPSIVVCINTIVLYLIHD